MSDGYGHGHDGMGLTGRGVYFFPFASASGAMKPSFSR